MAEPERHCWPVSNKVFYHAATEQGASVIGNWPREGYKFNFLPCFSIVNSIN